VSAILVEAPGFLTTVQDLGRPGRAAAGISASGAADPIALRIGNRLVGNDGGAAAFELTIVGGAFRFTADGVVAIAGADPQGRLDDRPVASWRAFAVHAGETLACGALRGGARSYLCFRGGVSVPLLFGSASTHLLTGLGGFEGRALRAGDRVPLGSTVAGAPLPGSIDASAIPGYRAGEPFRVTPGPQSDWFDEEAHAVFHETDWRVAEACDRMGIRLKGGRVRQQGTRELTTEGVPLGAIQIPPDGEPIVLFVEHQTTGGYPKIANVVSADLPAVGQLRPRDRVRFEAISLERARALLREQADFLDDALEPV
jgi:antagonist of KipI